MNEANGGRAYSEALQTRRLAIIIAAIAVVALALRFWPAFTFLDGIELRALDWRFARRGEREPNPRIAIVNVDEAGIAEVGRWPWPRREFARVIRTINDAGAKAIVFDIFFADPDAFADGPASDAELVEATRASGIVYHAAFGHASEGGDDDAGVPVALEAKSWRAARVLKPGGLNAAAGLFEIGDVTPPLPGLVEAARGVGFVNVVDSGDGIFRHTFPVVMHEGRLYPSLSVAAAAGLLDVEPDQVVIRPGRSIDLGGRRRIPIDRMGRMLIDFAGGAQTYPYVPVGDVLAMADRPDVAAEQFRDKVVFIAVTVPGLYDLRASPFDSVYFGVETQANALANILDGDFLRHASGESCILIVIGLGVAMFFGMTRLRPVWAITFAAALLVGYNWVAMWVFEAGLAIDVVAPTVVILGATVAGLGLRLMSEETERERVWGALARFAPAAVLERLVEEDPEALLRGQRRDLTVLFADIRNFTAQSEALGPEQTVELLNRFFYLVHETIWEMEGTLDKYMGDGLMAFWNAPLDQPDHALLAVQAAVHMQRRLQYNQAEWEFLGMPDLVAGIGISSGEAVVGYVGTGERMQYTAIGAHVNLASRLEGMTKEVGCSILISRQTYEAVAHAIEARSLGPVEVRGFSEPVEVYEVLDLKE